MSVVSGSEADRASWADAGKTAPGTGTNASTNANPLMRVLRLDANNRVFHMESNATLRIQ